MSFRGTLDKDEVFPGEGWLAADKETTEQQ
jgi:hypothetical protein